MSEEVVEIEREHNLHARANLAENGAEKRETLLLSQ